MGREVRRVPETWKHPKGDDGQHIPLHDGFNERAATWDRQAALWAKGLRDPWSSEGSEPVPHGKDCTFEEWDGSRPKAENYMPDWPAEERTHYQMYETCSEGTPISPVMDCSRDSRGLALLGYRLGLGARLRAGSTGLQHGGARMTLPRLTVTEYEALQDRAREDVEAAHDAALFMDCDFWDWRPAEELPWSELREAVEAYLDASGPTIPDGSTQEFTGYKRMRMSPNDPDPDMVLEYVMESLDDGGEYNTGDEPTEITEPMREAAREFCRVIRREYVPWNCEEACVVVYDAETLKRIAAELWPEETKA